MHVHSVTCVDASIVLDGDSNPRKVADLLMSKIVPLGQRFYPSESAFPLRSCLLFVLHVLLDLVD